MPDQLRTKVGVTQFVGPASDDVIQAKRDTDSFARFVVKADGTAFTGDGTAPPATPFYGTFQEHSDSATLPAGGTKTVPDTTITTVHNYAFGTGNCTFIFPTASAGKKITIGLKQDSVGSRTATWPITVLWSGGVSTLSAAASAQDLAVFQCIDGVNWLATLTTAYA